MFSLLMEKEYKFWTGDYVNNNSRWDITIDIMIDGSLTLTYDRVGVGVGVACRSSTE